MPKFDTWIFRADIRAVYATKDGLLGAVQDVQCEISPGFFHLRGAILDGRVSPELPYSKAEGHSLIGTVLRLLPNGVVFPGGSKLGPAVEVSSPWWPDGRRLLLLCSASPSTQPASAATAVDVGSSQAPRSAAAAPTHASAAEQSRATSSTRTLHPTASLHSSFAVHSFDALCSAFEHAHNQCPRLNLLCTARLPTSPMPTGHLQPKFKQVRLRAGAVGRTLLLSAQPAAHGGSYAHIVPGRSGLVVGIDEETQVHVRPRAGPVQGSKRARPAHTAHGSDADTLGSIVMRNVVLHRGHSWFLPTGSRHMDEMILMPHANDLGAQLKPTPLRRKGALPMERRSSRSSSFDSDGGEGEGPVVRLENSADLPQLSEGWSAAAQRWWGPERRLFVALRQLQLAATGKWGTHLSCMAARIQKLWRRYKKRVQRGEASREHRLQRLYSRLQQAEDTRGLASPVFGLPGGSAKRTGPTLLSLGRCPFSLHQQRPAAPPSTPWTGTGQGIDLQVVSMPSKATPWSQVTVLLLVPGLTAPEPCPYGQAWCWGHLLRSLDTDRTLVLQVAWHGARWLEDALKQSAEKALVPGLSSADWSVRAPAAAPAPAPLPAMAESNNASKSTAVTGQAAAVRAKVKAKAAPTTAARQPTRAPLLPEPPSFTLYSGMPEQCVPVVSQAVHRMASLWMDVHTPNGSIKGNGTGKEWKCVSSHNSVRTWSTAPTATHYVPPGASADDGFVAGMGESYLPFSVGQVLAYLWADERAGKDMDHMLDSTTPLAIQGRADPLASPVPWETVTWYMSHMKCKGVFPTDPRDFCSAGGWQAATEAGMPAGSVICWGTSVQHPSAPKAKGYVRGILDVGGWVLTPCTPAEYAAGAKEIGVSGPQSMPGSQGGCRATYIFRTAIGGSVPVWLMQQVSAGQCKTPLQLYKLLAAKASKAGGKELPSMQDAVQTMLSQLTAPVKQVVPAVPPAPQSVQGFADLEEDEEDELEGDPQEILHATLASSSAGLAVPSDPSSSAQSTAGSSRLLPAPGSDASPAVAPKTGPHSAPILTGMSGLALLPSLVAQQAFRTAWRDSGPIGSVAEELAVILRALCTGGEAPPSLRAALLGLKQGSTKHTAPPPLVVIAQGMGARLALSALSIIGAESQIYGDVNDGVPRGVPTSVCLLGACTSGPEDAGPPWSTAAAAVSRALINVHSKHDTLLSKCVQEVPGLGLTQPPAGVRPVLHGVYNAPKGALVDIDASARMELTAGPMGNLGGHSYADHLPGLLRSTLPTLLPLR